MVCSVRQHPLSAGSGRKRYNTLDFAQQNRVPTGHFHPYWKPRIKGICHPFEIPAVLKSVYTNQKTVFAPTHPKTKNPHSRSDRKERLWGLLMPRSARHSCLHYWESVIYRKFTVNLPASSSVNGRPKEKAATVAALSRCFSFNSDRCSLSQHKICSVLSGSISSIF